ncbi:DUF6567 family protein [Flavobacterium sp.]|uniref:DUF6567 family protein n=1 Tax=Flavobacterium sp. TaxID=239 RepID=UPI003753D43F
MKRVLCFLVLSLMFLITSCGGSASVMGNGNLSQTNVELTKKNFKIVRKVSGESSNKYICGIGGSANRALLEKAKNNMMENANLKDSQAVVYITYDKHINGFFPFYSKITITCSAYLVEFTE